MLFVSACLFIDVTPIMAAGETTAGTLTATPGDKSLAIVAPYVEDGVSNSTLLIEWGLNAEDFTLGSQLLPNAPTPYAFSITGLDNGTAYQVRVTWQDPDNAVEPTQTLTGLIPFNKLIHNSRSTGSAKWAPVGWGVAGGKYGEFACGTCHERNTSNIKKIKETIATPDASEWNGPAAAAAAVVFTDARNGSADFGNDADDHASSERICEICHSRNSYHNYDVKDNVGGDTGHYNQADCVQCHRHSDGFKANCDSCHGVPPLIDTAQPQNGLVITPNPTGSDSAGAHDTHTNRYSYPCATCHYNGMPISPVSDNNALQIGFSGVADNSVGAEYHGRAALSTPFVYEGTNGTAISNDGALTCANVYCHGTLSPAWDGSSPDPQGDGNSCNNCHDYPPGNGAHPAHVAAGFGDCRICHELTTSDGVSITAIPLHANASNDVSFDDGYDLGASALGAGDYDSPTHSCSIYCHGDGQGVTSTPDWDLPASGACGTCHGNPPAGSVHNIHIADLAGPQLGCETCHPVGSSDGSHDQHYNGEINLGGGGGSGCEPCHGHDNDYEYAPGQFSSGAGTAISHSTHTENDSDDAHGPNIPCATCHDTGNYPLLADGKTLAETSMCDSCHSSGGSYDGVSDAAIGVRNNWTSGVYAGTSLKAGKELWCIGCHDQIPAKSKSDGSGVAAPNQAGNAATYGYYLTGHGATSGYKATRHGRNGPGYACLTCHDKTVSHINHTLGDNRLKTVDDALAYTSDTSEVCLDCHATGQSTNGVLGYDAAAEATVHSGAVTGNFNSSASAASAFPAYGDAADYSANPGYQCEACHDAHGTPKLAMVRATLDGKLKGTSTPVSVPGFEASDTSLGDLDPTSSDNDGVCDSCHAGSGNTAPHPDSTRPGNHNQGRDCASCHPHDNSFRVECTACHDYPPQTNAHPIHTTTLNYGCEECHFNHNHNPRNIKTTPAEFYNDYDRAEIEVVFDMATFAFNSDYWNGSLPPAAYTQNASPAAATCANLTCHNPDNMFTGKGKSYSGDDVNNISKNVPVWGSTITSCRSCHVGVGMSDGTRDSHLRHGNSCTNCHAAVNVIDPAVNGTDARHGNKSLEINQNGVYPVSVNASMTYRTGITATYTDGAPNTKTGSTCKDVYCHGSNELKSSMGINPTLTWGVSAVGSGSCSACHRYTSSQVQGSGNKSHAAHAGGIYGPQTVDCGYCHQIGSPSGHLNGRLDLKNGTTLAGTTVCDNCHGTTEGIDEAKTNWPLNMVESPHRITDCLFCHNGSKPANSKMDGRGVIAADVSHFFSTGHGRSGSPFAVTGNDAPGYLCTICHDPDSRHVDGKIGVELRLKPVPALGLDYLSPASEQCLDCHQAGQSTVGSLGFNATKKASIHSGAILDSYNTDDSSAYPAYGERADYSANPGYQCADCHSVHGSSKVAMLLPAIVNGMDGNSSGVAIPGLEAASSTDFTGLDPSPAANDGFCDACHANSGDAHPDTSQPNNHFQGTTGQSCKACHNHAKSFAPEGAHAAIIDQTGDKFDQSVDFGSLVTTSTADQTITIKSIGTANLSIGTIASTDPLVAPFALISGSDHCSGQTLPPGSACTFDIRFAPTATGNSGDTFDIPSIDLETPVTITLSGIATATGPDIVITDAVAPVTDRSLPFGEQVLNVAVNRIISLTNNGIGDLTIDPIPTGNLLDPPFSLTDTCSGVLTPGSSCPLTITYNATTLGTHSDSFDVTSNDPDEGTVTIQVSGTGINPVYAYVQSDETIARIRTHDNFLIPSTAPYGHMAVAPDGSELYTNSNLIASYFNVYPANLESKASLSLPSYHYTVRMAMPPSGAYVYVAYNINTSASTRLQLFDTATDTFTSTNVQLPEADSWGVSYPAVYAIAVSPDGQYIYTVTRAFNSSLWTYLADLTVRRTIDASVVTSVFLEQAIVTAIAALPDNSKIYLLNDGSNASYNLVSSVSVVQTSDFTALPPIVVENGLRDLTLSPDGTILYVLSSNSAKSVDTLTLVDTASDVITKTVDLVRPTGCVIERFAVTPDGNRLYMFANAASGANDYVVVYDSTDFGAQPVIIDAGVNTNLYDIVIQTDDPNASWPDIQITDTSGLAGDQGVPFGSVVVNTTAATQTITVANRGTENLVVGAVAASNPVAAPFSLLSDGCSGQTLTPSATCTLTVSYTPTAEGTAYDSFDIPSNDPDEKIASITLSGTGAYPDITVTDNIAPSDDLLLPFGTRPATGYKYPYKTITVKNDGAAGLIFGNITTTAPFSVSNVCSSYTSAPGLPPGSTCTLYIYFGPTVEGEYSATVNIPSNDPDESLVSINVTGAGATSPDIALLATTTAGDPEITSLDFGYFDINGTQVSKTFYGRNYGAQNLIFGTMSLPAEPGPFSIYTDSLSGKTVASNNISAASRIDFNPTTSGTFNAQLEIPSNDPDASENPAILQLTGTGFEKMAGFIPFDDSIMLFVPSYNASGAVSGSQYVSRVLDAGASPTGSFATPSISYVTLAGTDQLQFYQTSTRTLLATTAVGDDPRGVVATPDGLLIYVANHGDNTVSVVARNTQTLVATIAVGHKPFGIDATPDNSRIYVTNYADDTVSVIDIATNTVTATIPVGAKPLGITISPDGTTAYVTNSADDTVSILDLATNTETMTIAVGANPYGVSITPDGSRVYVANFAANSVSVIDTASNIVSATITGITAPMGIAAAPDGRLVHAISYSTVLAESKARLIQTSDNTVVVSVNTGYNAGTKARAFGEFLTFARYGTDNDGIPDAEDNCPVTTNPLQTDSDGNGIGDVCDACPNDLVDDSDGDGVCTGALFTSPMTAGNDNCPTLGNADQLDGDADGIGDACELCPDDQENDMDADGICDGTLFNAPKTAAGDNCPAISNPDQLDSDNDGLGNVCDNCPDASNADQLDLDGDGVGDTCDSQPSCGTEPTPIWEVKAGLTGVDDSGDTIALDAAGNVYVAGYSTSTGSRLAKYDPYGKQKWSLLYGTANGDFNHGLAVDSAGNSYVTGRFLAGAPDYWQTRIESYDADGSRLWRHDFGAGGADGGRALAMDSSDNIYLTGETNGELVIGQHKGAVDIFLAKYDSAGSQTWIKQLGTSSDDYGMGIAVDSSGASYVTGYTMGALETGQHQGGRDLFVVKYATDGTPLWKKQFGTTADEEGLGIAVDATFNSYITGYTEGSLTADGHQGLKDLFIIKLDTTGNRLWSHQFGTTNDDQGTGIAVDAAGAIVLTGFYNQTTVSPTDIQDDLTVMSFDSDGNLLWNGLLGGSGHEGGNAVTIDGNGMVYVAGYGGSDLAGGKTSLYLFKTGPCPLDPDGDGIMADSDNCPQHSNANQLDSDGDGFGNVCDVCPTNIDPLQIDSDGDGIGDVCDVCTNDPNNDQDLDGVCGDRDNCPATANGDQADADSDGIGNLCDFCPTDASNDQDLDGLCGSVDNCPNISNADQADSDCDGHGDACSTPVYSAPEAFSVSPSPQMVTEATLSWNDVFNGEDGYRIERKDEACSADTLEFATISTIYRHDAFTNGIDTSAWSPSATVQTASTQVAPYAVDDVNGAAEVSWENGAIKLHTVASFHADGDKGYNVSSLAPKNYVGILGDKDFDLQYDFSYSLTNASHLEYNKYLSIDAYFPATSGGNSMYVSRQKNGYFTGIQINGVNSSGLLPTSDQAGTLRLIRKNRRLSGYAWDGTGWHLLHEHSSPLDNDVAPVWIGASQVIRRNELSGQEITTYVDNFRLNTAGGQPVAVLQLDFAEAQWLGDPNEVIDATVGNNHGTSSGGATVTVDTERGTVGLFDGIDDYIQISGAGSLQNVTDASFTFAAWAKPMSVPAHSDPNPPADNWIYTIMGRPGWHLDLHYNQNKQFRFEMWNSDDPATPDPPVDPMQFGVNSAIYEPGVWHHLAGVVDDTNKIVSLYVDGQLAGTAPYTGTLRDFGSAPYLIGTSNHDASAYNWFFDGMIDDVRVFDRALSASEVATLQANRMQFRDNGLTTGNDYCYRVYPIKSDSCPNWSNHAAQSTYTAPDNQLPAQPLNVTPLTGSIEVPLTPTLTASTFSDADAGDTHGASQWQLSLANGDDFDGALFYNSGVVSGTESHAVTVPGSFATLYYWKVRYQDSKGEWSPWSAETSYTSIIDNMPDQPVNALPADGAIDVIERTPTLTASTFNDTDAGDSHLASQWQISTASGTSFEGSIVYDSNSQAAAVSHTLTTPLARETPYFWRVRYQDSKTGWSTWSNQTTFTILNNPPATPTNIFPASGAEDVELKPLLTASSFSDADSGDTQQASQWQVSNDSGAAFEGNIVYDSGSQPASNNHTVTSDLAGITLHYWRVRYQDDSGDWSLWSSESSFTTSPVLADTISYWRFDEGIGSTTADLVGPNPANLVVSPNNPTWTADSISGSALLFDGLGDEIYWGYSGGVPANTFTLEASVKASVTHGIDTESQTGTGGVSGQKYLFWSNYPGDSSRTPYPGVNSLDAGMGISLGTNGISVYEHGSGYMPTHAVYSGALGTGWNHVIIVYNNKTPYIYLNGVLVRTGITSTRRNVYAPVRMGYGQYGHFQGTVDEAAVYNRALNAAEVKTRCEVIKGIGQCN